MKHIILMRHAKSDWENNLSDHQRPLNKRGKRDAPQMAQEIINRGFLPELVLSSDSQRTRETLELMQNSLGDCKTIFTSSLYLASEKEIIDSICQLDDTYSTVMILAHNPGITDVFYSLANARIDNVPTAGVGCIKFDVNKFAEIKDTTGELVYFVYPKMLF